MSNYLELGGVIYASHQTGKQRSEEQTDCTVVRCGEMLVRCWSLLGTWSLSNYFFHFHYFPPYVLSFPVVADTCRNCKWARRRRSAAISLLAVGWPVASPARICPMTFNSFEIEHLDKSGVFRSQLRTRSFFTLAKSATGEYA